MGRKHAGKRDKGEKKAKKKSKGSIKEKRKKKKEKTREGWVLTSVKDNKVTFLIHIPLAGY